MYTVHTMESMLNLRVHIAPVGFEIDRIVIPAVKMKADLVYLIACLLYTSPSPRDRTRSRMPSSA